MLGEHFREIFPEDAWLDLQVEPTMWGDKIRVSIENRSDETLHNATLILAVHFTDMHPDDYEPFAAERTIPAVLPHETTDFGTMSIATELWGTPKSVADVVQHRAILVTDEAVLWVDTDEYKIAEAKEFRDALKNSHPLPEQRSDWYLRMERELDGVRRDLDSEASVEVTPRYGFADDVTIELPAELGVFKPHFTLKYAGQTFDAKTNVIDDEHILLTFAGVANWDGKDVQAEDMVLTIDSIFGGMEVTFAPDGEASYRFGGVADETPL